MNRRRTVKYGCYVGVPNGLHDNEMVTILDTEVYLYGRTDYTATRCVVFRKFNDTSAKKHVMALDVFLSQFRYHSKVTTIITQQEVCR
jgi:hypothetical protein